MTESWSKKELKQAEEVMRNEDLLLQVLLKLPAKSLIRFKSVSRRWLSLISDPKFCSKHTRLNPTSSTLGIYFHHNHKYSSDLKSVSLHRANQEDLPTLTFIEIAFLKLHFNLPAIMHACNGLLLCHYTYNRPYFVCNIATQTFTILPQHRLPTSGWDHGDHSAYLVCDPSKSPHFKVVLLRSSVRTPDTILHDDDDYKETTSYYTGFFYEIDVYSTEAGVWERKYFRAPDGLHIDYKAVCDGSLHWITKKKYHVQFEVESWKLKYNPLPQEPEPLKVEKIRYFGECSRRLFLIHIRFKCAKSFNVLGLDKNESSWTVKYRVNLRPLIAAFPDSFRFSDPRGVAVMDWNFSVLCVVKENKTHEFALLLSIPGKVISYNMIRNTFKVLHEFPMQEFPRRNGYNFAHTFPLMATLSPV